MSKRNVTTCSSKNVNFLFIVGVMNIFNSMLFLLESNVQKLIITLCVSGNNLCCALNDALLSWGLPK